MWLRALCGTLIIATLTGGAQASSAQLKGTQLAQQRWLKSQLIIVDNRQKRLDKRFGYTAAPKTLCADASADGVGWAKRYCSPWGGGLYLDWEQNNGMFKSAHDALSTALYVVNRRALRRQETDVYAWGMREWKISESTFEGMLDTVLANDVHEMKMLDAAEPYCEKSDYKTCFAMKDREEAYEKAHRCDFSPFTRYTAFTSVDEYNDKVVKMHTSPAIAKPRC
jgi:hypothetical protein